MNARVAATVGGCALTALVGCSGESQSNLTSANGLLAPWQSALGSYRYTRPRSSHIVLYSFKGSNVGDGKFPQAVLTRVNGVLYGATYSGGTNRKGTVFKVTTAGAETVLHSFGGVGDGAYPVAGLINVGGRLYGTTPSGGAHGSGIVFAITTAGEETVLHSFGNGNDGADPVAGLTNVGGTLYGTTWGGGARGYGTVFSITTSGTETVLYSFCKLASCDDGAYPEAPLAPVGGTFYGTTWSGNGTVFKVTTAGVETVLHNFAGSDGSEPTTGLTSIGNTLYGTTRQGGDSCPPWGCGTIYKITTGGAFSRLYSFFGGSDGNYPMGELTNVNGILYGTTAGGGASEWGTIYSITTSGTYSQPYAFGSAPDGGIFPEAGLTNVKGTLYGTTRSGGKHAWGTVYSFSGF